MLRTLRCGLGPHVELVSLRAGESRRRDVLQLSRPIDRQGEAGLVPEADIDDVAVAFLRGPPADLLQLGFFQQLAIEGFRIDGLGGCRGSLSAEGYHAWFGNSCVCVVGIFGLVFDHGSSCPVVAVGIVVCVVCCVEGWHEKKKCVGPNE